MCRLTRDRERVELSRNQIFSNASAGPEAEVEPQLFVLELAAHASPDDRNNWSEKPRFRPRNFDRSVRSSVPIVPDAGKNSVTKNEILDRRNFRVKPNFFRFFGACLADVMPKEGVQSSAADTDADADARAHDLQIFRGAT